MIPFAAGAIETLPWYGRDLELHLRATSLTQQYNRVNVGDGSRARASFDEFLTLGMEGSYSEWQVEFETELAHSRDHEFGFDHFTLAGRYQVFDDILGDPVTATAGIRLIRALKSGLYDISSFHHGKSEAVFSLAVGRETAFRADWLSRVWGSFGFGIADFGSPWLEGDLAWEKNWPFEARLSIFTHLLGGFGKNHLNIHHFRGYGPIRHRSIDVGFKYDLMTDCYGIIGLGYAYRVYAKNFPQHTSRLTVSIEY